MRARENPFRTQRILEWRYRLPETTSWPALLDRLGTMRFRGAIVGPHGCGKTTLLEDLCVQLEADGHRVDGLRINSESAGRWERPLACLERCAVAETIVVIDGAEQIGWWRWQRVLLRSHLWRGLIITTHRAGRLPLLFECQPQFEMLRDMVRHLAPHLPETLTSRLPELYREHQGNLRLCLRSLYDWVAETSADSG
jgi:hypothetical protein